VSKVTFACSDGALMGKRDYTGWMNEKAIAPPTPWSPSPLAPLNLAALITWLAVLLQSLRWERLQAGNELEWGGVLALLAVGGLYMLSNAQSGSDARGERRQRALVIAQAVATLVAAACLRNIGPAVLLIIVAAQVMALWPRRVAILGLATVNLTLVAIWVQWVPLMSALLGLLPMIGFQTFAALTVHYAVSAERAREELGATHAQLLATQQLLEDSARSGERLRLSRELHDVAGHKLTALKLNLRLLLRDPVLAEREEVRVSAALADELLADIRAVVSELRKYDGIDLATAIRTLTQQIPGPRFVVEIDPALRVTDLTVAETLLRCAQEGITNALRHARASEIRIECRNVGERVELAVRNDGPPLLPVAFGNGLTGMRERLSAAGGELILRARAGGGAELLAAVPTRG